MSDDALPLCACEQYYESHHPECPARRAHEAALLKLETSQVALKGAEERAKMLLDAMNHWAELARTAESKLDAKEMEVVAAEAAQHTLQRHISKLRAQLDQVDKARSDDAKGFERRLADAYARNRAVTAERDMALQAHRDARDLWKAAEGRATSAECRLDRIRKLHRDAAMDQSSHHKRDTFMGFLGALGATLDDHPSTTSPVDAHAGGEMSGKHDAACLVSVSGGLDGPCDCAGTVTLDPPTVALDAGTQRTDFVVEKSHTHEWLDISTHQTVADGHRLYLCNCGETLRVVERPGPFHAHVWVRLGEDDQLRCWCGQCRPVERRDPVCGALFPPGQFAVQSCSLPKGHVGEHKNEVKGL